MLFYAVVSTSTPQVFLVCTSVHSAAHSGLSREQGVSDAKFKSDPSGLVPFISYHIAVRVSVRVRVGSHELRCVLGLVLELDNRY